MQEMTNTLEVPAESYPHDNVTSRGSSDVTTPQFETFQVCRDCKMAREKIKGFY